MRRKGRIKKNQVKYFTSGELERFMKAVEKWGNERDKFMFEFLLATGLRVSELINLNVKDVKDKNMLVIVGKGRKERIIPLLESIKEKIKKFLEWKRGQGECLRMNCPLFCNKTGGRISQRGVRERVYYFCDKAGLERRFSPHSFRHTLGFRLGKNKVPLQVIQKVMGHSSILTTRIYTEPDLEQVEDALKCVNF